MIRAETWNLVIEQASRGDAHQLILLTAAFGHWPEDQGTRLRLLVVLMLGPWQKYRAALLKRLLAREEPFQAGVEELKRLMSSGREGAAWLGTSGRPAVLNDEHRAKVRSFYASLRTDNPDWPERDVREQVRTAFKLEDISEATLRKILGVKKTAG
jgi:hypothetical protein